MVGSGAAVSNTRAILMAYLSPMALSNDQTLSLWTHALRAGTVQCGQLHGKTADQ